MIQFGESVTAVNCATSVLIAYMQIGTSNNTRFWLKALYDPVGKLQVPKQQHLEEEASRKKQWQSFQKNSKPGPYFNSRDVRE